MGVEAHTADERATGRTWTVRLDPVGRGRTDVRVSCSRPGCAPQVLPSATAGRAAAVAHLKAHLRTGPPPRATVYCACRASECHTHIRPAGPRERPVPWRCGGAVVLAVVTDREGRWWQVMECCARCAAAHPTAKVVATAPPPERQAPAGGFRPPTAASASPPTPVGPHFSHIGAGPQTVDGTAAPREVPAPRPARQPRKRPRRGRIAQRFVPHELRPVELRDELTELGELFRAYQQREEPDLEVLADLHARKAEAFTAWAEVTGDTGLREDAERAEQAAATVRLQHLHRIGQAPVGDGPVVDRLLSAPTHWEHARAVLAHVTEHAPLPGPDARLLVVMVTLRTAQSGTGNLVGQDLRGLPLEDAEGIVSQLVECGWMEISGTVEELAEARPENPTRVSVPSLTPGGDEPGPFTFGRKVRPKLSGWAQRVVGDKKLRKARTASEARLLALALATDVLPDGRLGAGGEGIALADLAPRCAVDPDALPGLVELLAAKDWLTDVAVTGTRLTGRLSERVLPLSCPLTS